MPKQTNTTTTKRPVKKLVLIFLSVIIVAGLIWLALVALQEKNKNLAAEAAKPIEKALADAGAKKICESGDNGRGWDNQNPWYHALYELPGNSDNSTTSLKLAASKAGFSLKESAPPANPEDNKFYEDKTSVVSTFSQLQPGKASLLAEIYGSKVFSGDTNSCTVKSSVMKSNKTTFDFTLSLPDYK